MMKKIIPIILFSVVLTFIFSLSVISGEETDRIKTISDTSFESEIKLVDSSTTVHDTDITRKTLVYETEPLLKDIDGEWKLTGSSVNVLYVNVTSINDGSKIIYGNVTVSISNGDMSKQCVLWNTDDYLNESVISSSFPCYGTQIVYFPQIMKDMISAKTFDDYLVVQVRELVNPQNVFSVIPESSRVAVEFDVPRYFAKLDRDNIVTSVIVADPDFIMNHADGTWAETWLDADNPRKRYAGIGMSYNGTSDLFIEIKPYPSWILNQTDGSWYAPVPMPKDGDYYWDEDLQNWVLIESADEPLIIDGGK